MLSKHNKIKYKVYVSLVYTIKDTLELICHSLNSQTLMFKKSGLKVTCIPYTCIWNYMSTKFKRKFYLYCKTYKSVH